MSPRITNRVSSYGSPSWSMLVCHTSSTGTPGRSRSRRVAAYLGDTKGVVLATYAHFMPDDDDRAREIMNAFFAPTREGADHDPCALIVPGDRHE
jgi:hypothetical protein